jgi:hypothetical protein
MCDFSSVRNWLIATVVTIFAVVALLIVAGPLGMIAAAALTGVAIGCCTSAIAALDTFCVCAGPSCAGPCSGLRALLVIANMALAVQVAACLANALAAFIPFYGLWLIWSIIIPLIVQAIIILGVLAALSRLATCQATSAPPLPQPNKPPTSPI